MFSGPGAFHRLAGELLAAARDGLAAGPYGAPGRACVVPGAIAWDDCECHGGQLAVSVTRYWRTANFPVELGGEPGGQTPCDAAFLAADLLVQVIRCAPGPQEDGSPPPCEELDAAAAQATDDAYRVRVAVRCRLASLEDAGEIVAWVTGAQPALGPEGGCVGSQLGAAAALPDPCCD
jgi:hypothetical protein